MSAVHCGMPMAPSTGGGARRATRVGRSLAGRLGGGVAVEGAEDSSAGLLRRLRRWRRAMNVLPNTPEGAPGSPRRIQNMIAHRRGQAEVGRRAWSDIIRAMRIFRNARPVVG